MAVPQSETPKEAIVLDRKLHEEMFHFHDALVLDLVLNIAKRFASITLQAYPTYESKDRKLVVLWFEDVSSISSTVDLKEMQRNEVAGTVVAIRLHERDQTTKIYLTGGAILIRSKSPKMT